MGIEGREYFQKEGMWLAMANGFYFHQNLNFFLCILCNVYFNKCCINIYILNCNKIIILHSACTKLSMVVTTVLNYI